MSSGMYLYLGKKKIKKLFKSHPGNESTGSQIYLIIKISNKILFKKNKNYPIVCDCVNKRANQQFTK